MAASPPNDGGWNAQALPAEADEWNRYPNFQHDIEGQSANASKEFRSPEEITAVQLAK